MASKPLAALTLAALVLSAAATRADDSRTPRGPTSIVRRPASTATSSTGNRVTSSASTRSNGGVELKWRAKPQATPIGLDGSRSIKRTQMLERIETGKPKNSLPEIDVEELPVLEPQLQGVSQPGEAQPEPAQPEPRRGLQPGFSQPGLTQPEEEQPLRPRSPLEQRLQPRQAPTFDPAELSRAPLYRPEDCERYRNLKKISQIDTSLEPSESGELPQWCTLGDSPFEGRAWSLTTYTWKASGVCHKPLYWEEPDLERYGHTWKHWQPLVSAGHFFGTFPLLPYKMGIEAPWECMYALGYYEPGSCAPYIVPAVPLNVRGALLEAGAWTGGVILIP